MVVPVNEPPDLAELKGAVDVAVAATQAPPTAGVTEWPFTLPQEHFTQDDSDRVWSVVRWLRRNHRVLFRRFLSQWTMFDFIVDYVAQTATPTLEGLVAELTRRTEQERTWLVSVPLLNCVPPHETVALGERAMLVRTDSTRRAGPRFGSYLADSRAVRNHLGDELTPWDRWLRASGRREVDLDTRMTASLLLVEDGIEELATDIAESRARLAVAMWCLLSRPGLRHDRRQPWPTVGWWTPAPYVEFGMLRKLYEPGRSLGRPGASRRGSSVITHDVSYRLTRSEPYLRAPFVAMDRARRGSDCAIALLSAARSLYLAEQSPNFLGRTERVLHVWRAKEALSHRRGQGKSQERWRRLVVNLRLRSELRARAYELDEIDEAFELVESLRDLTTHLGDDVLVNLGYPERLRTHLKRGRVLDSDTLSLALVAADWPVILSTVRVAARRLVKGAIKNNWDDRWFHSRFV